MLHMRNFSGKYLQIVFYIFILISVVFLMGITRECGTLKTKNLEGNSGGDTIDIAIIYAPQSIYFHGDSLGGINKEVASQFSIDENLPVKLWPVANLQDAMKKVETGTFDILAALPLDQNIKERFLTSESIFLDRLVLVQLIDSVDSVSIVKTPLDLHNKRIEIPSGSPALQRLQNLANEIGGDIEVHEARGLSEELLCIRVAGGKIPLAVVSEKTAMAMSEEYPQLSYDNPISFTQFQVWLFNPNDSVLLKRFNDWFSEFKTTPHYNAILKKF